MITIYSLHDKKRLITECPNRPEAAHHNDSHKRKRRHPTCLLLAPQNLQPILQMIPNPQPAMHHRANKHAPSDPAVEDIELLVPNAREEEGEGGRFEGEGEDEGEVGDCEEAGAVGVCY